MGLDLLKKEMTDDELKGCTPEDLGRAIRSMSDMVIEHKKQIDDGLRTRDESEAEFKLRLNDAGRMIEELKKTRPNPDQVNDLQGAYAARKGGLFRKASPLLPYDELLSLSPTSSIVRGEDAELLKDLQDAHDAVVFKFHAECYVKKTPEKPQYLEECYERTYKGRDFSRYADLIRWTGYADKDYGKTDEVIHPAAGGAANPVTMQLVSGRVMDLVRLNLSVANQFPEFPMANFDVKIPVNRADDIGVRGGAGVLDPPPRDFTATQIPPVDHIGTISLGTAQLVSEDVMAYLWWNDRAVSDTVIAMVPYLRTSIAVMHARAIDRACMSGDEGARVAGAGMDDHASAFTVQDARALWPGLRKIGENNYTDLGALIDGDDVRDGLKRMGVYGMNKNALRMWMNTGPIYDLMKDPSVITIDKYGTNATIVTGELARIYGVPILPTEWIPTDLDGEQAYSP